MRIISIAVVCALSVVALASSFEAEGGSIDEAPELASPYADTEVRTEGIFSSDGNVLARSRDDSSFELGSTMSSSSNLLPNLLRTFCPCTREFFPMCCSVNGMFMATSNPCRCRCIGKIIHSGLCRPESGNLPSRALDDDIEASSQLESTLSSPLSGLRKLCVCTRELNPTCCKTAKGSVTASNPCTCKCQGGKPLHSGPCKICACPRILRPVCCSHKTGTKMSLNKCSCGCAGGKVLPPIACLSRVKCSSCRKVFRPVCCKTRDSYMVAANRCFCVCKGRRVTSNRNCLYGKH